MGIPSISNDNQDGIASIVVISVFGGLALVSVGLRLYAHHLQEHWYPASDMFCILALMASVALIVQQANGVAYGVGINVWEMTVTDFRGLNRNNIAANIEWGAAVTFVRLSIIFLYIKLFKSRGLFIGSWILIVENVLTFIAVVLSGLLICRPLDAYLNLETDSYSCGDRIKLETWQGIWNLLNDFALVVLPMPTIWKLKMTTAKKRGLSAIFGFGVLICIITLIRVVITLDYMSANYTRQWAPIGILTGLEPLLGIVNSCLPFIPAVTRRMAGSSALRSLNSWSSVMTLIKNFLRSSPERGSDDSKDEDNFPRQTTVNSDTLDRILSPSSHSATGEASATHKTNMAAINGIGVRTEVRVEQSPAPQ